METKTVYQLLPNGVYIGMETACKSPLEKDVWLIPAGCIEVEPPVFDSNRQYAIWNGEEYEIKDIPEKV